MKIAARTPEEYLEALDEPRRSEVERLHRLIRETVPSLEPVMVYGMIGYGPFHYRYASGREGDTAKIALASQKNYISLYICATDSGGHLAEQFKPRLPKADIGKGCVRFKRTADLDEEVLRDLFRRAESCGYEG